MPCLVFMGPKMLHAGTDFALPTVTVFPAVAVETRDLGFGIVPYGREKFPSSIQNKIKNKQ